MTEQPQMQTITVRISIRYDGEVNNHSAEVTSVIPQDLCRIDDECGVLACIRRALLGLGYYPQTTNRIRFVEDDQ